MSIVTTDHGAHLVHLDADRGVGALVLPDEAEDIPAEPPTLLEPWKDGGIALHQPHRSLHESSWDAALARLEGEGWALLQGEEDDDTPRDSLGWPSHQLGWTQDGQTVLALYRPDDHPATLAELEVSLVGLALEQRVLVRWAGFNISH